MTMVKRYDVVTRKLSDLKPAPYNPRRMTQPALGALKASLERFGLVQPIVVNRATGHVVGGHQRLEALRQIGAEEVDVVEVDLDEVQEKALNLALNNPLAQGEFTADVVELAHEIGPELGELFDDLRLGNLAASIDIEEVASAVDPDATAEAVDPDDPAVDVQPGDVWVLGRHRLACGDSRDPDVWQDLMRDESGQCMWTDPPYGVDYQGASKKRERIEDDDDASAVQLVSTVLPIAVSALAPGSAVYVACSPKPSMLVAFIRAMWGAGIRTLEELIWVKDSIVVGTACYHPRHETVIYGHTPTKVGRFGRGWKGWYGDNSQTTVFEHQRPRASKIHPTMKPVELVATHLRNSCPPGGIVIDPFAGSGTTLIAAEETGAHARCIEISPRYCSAIIERWQMMTGEEATRE